MFLGKSTLKSGGFKKSILSVQSFGTVKDTYLLRMNLFYDLPCELQGRVLEWRGAVCIQRWWRGLRVRLFNLVFPSGLYRTTSFMFSVAARKQVRIRLDNMRGK